MLLASAGWSDRGPGRAGAAGDPDADQVTPPPLPAQPKTSPNAYFRAEAQAKLLQSSGPTLAWASVGKGPINGGYGPADTLPPFSGRGTSIAVSANVANDGTAC